MLREIVHKNWREGTVMKKLSVIVSSVVLLVVFPLLAQGATKTISQTPMTLIATLSPSDQTTGMVVRGKTIYLMGTVTGVVSTDGFVQAMDSTGTVKWSLPLDNGSNEIATAATFDSAGNIWVVGSAQTPLAMPNPSTSPTPTTSDTPSASPTTSVSASPSASPTTSVSASPTPSVLNPDGVSVDPSVPLRPDLTFLSLWKISPSGTLLAAYAFDMKSAFLVRSATLVNNKIAIVGLISTPSGHAGFLIQSDLSGTFGKPISVGKIDTELNAVARKSDGSLVLLGSSSETLAKQRRKGIKDGILVVVNPAGKISSVVRSSNTSSTRSWQSATNSFFLGGDAVSKTKSEAVVTKFGSTLIPSWTMRLTSRGPALGTDGPTSHFFVFPSIGAVAGVRGWKPSKPAALVLSLDSKGLLKGAYGASAIAMPMAIGYSRDLGLVVLGRGPVGVSVFHALPR